MAESEKQVESPLASPKDKMKEVGATVTTTESPDSPGIDPMINSSGHKQELDRNFSLISMCAIGVTAGNTWIAMGGSVVSSCFCPYQPHFICMRCLAVGIQAMRHPALMSVTDTLTIPSA